MREPCYRGPGGPPRIASYPSIKGGWGGGVKKQGDKRRGEWGRGWLITAAGLMDVRALNWLQMTAEAVFQSLMRRLLGLPSSLTFFLPHPVAAVRP